MEAEIEAVIKVGYYSSKSEVVKDALRLLFETRKELKIASAVELYKNGRILWNLTSRGIYRGLEVESTEEMDKR